MHCRVTELLVHSVDSMPNGLMVQAHAAATHVVKIPMSEQHVRSLNLAVSVGVGVFEAIRQLEDQQ